jgi:hypothetical protein
MYTDGDVCDLTKKPRTTEVRFVCDAELLHAFDSISETSTCNYLVVVHTSLVCAHKDFNSQTTVTRKTLCVAGDGASTRPRRYAELQDRLAAEETARAAAEKEAMRLAEQQLAEQRLRQQQQQKQQGSAGGAQQHQQADKRRGNRPQDHAAEPAKPGGAGNNAQQATAPDVNSEAFQNAANELLKRFFLGKQCFAGGQVIASFTRVSSLRRPLLL